MGSLSLTFQQKRTLENLKKMSRAILCLVCVTFLASIGHGRVIEKRSPGVTDFADKIDEAIDLRDIGGHIDTAIDAVGDFGSDAIDEITDFANSDGVRRVGDKVVDVANDVGDAFVDAGSAIGDFFGGLGRKKRSSWDHEEDRGPGLGSDIWDQIDKGSAAIGRFPTLTVVGHGSYKDFGTYHYRGPFKNFVLDETREYTAKALGKYYGDLLYQRYISSSAHRTTNSKFQILAMNLLIVYF